MKARVYVHSLEGVEKGQRREAGRKWLYEAVKAFGVSDLNEENCPLARTERGKPWFPSRPEVYFSISHSEMYWACAVSDACVGLDLQFHKPGRREDIAKQFFHPREYAWLKEQGMDHFFEVWTAKESYVKWTGQGIDRDFALFSVIPEAENEKMPVYFIRPFLEEGYTMCLCGGSPWENVELVRHWDEV